MVRFLIKRINSRLHEIGYGKNLNKLKPTYLAYRNTPIFIVDEVLRETINKNIKTI